VLAALGHMLAHSSADNFEEAERFLGEAIRLNPELASAHGNLARIYDISNRRAEAERAYEKAVQLGSGDAQVYLMYGDTILERIYREGTQNTARAEVLKARKLLEKAVQLDPKSARGWAGLGATYVATQDDPETGIAALQKSLTLARGQEDVAYNLVLLYAQNGRRDEAAKVVDTVIARKGNPKLLAQAREALLFADVRRIEALLREDKREEAVPLINTVLSQTTDEALKTYLNALLQQLASVDAAQNAFDKLERASKLAGERKFAEALKLIDEAIPLIDDANVAKQAKDFRAQVAAAAAKAKKK
jgi:tetratricopeptide (TPR) repeat protein